MRGIFLWHFPKQKLEIAKGINIQEWILGRFNSISETKINAYHDIQQNYVYEAVL